MQLFLIVPSLEAMTTSTVLIYYPYHSGSSQLSTNKMIDCLLLVFLTSFNLSNGHHY